MSEAISQRQHNQWMKQIIGGLAEEERALFRRSERRQRKREGEAAWKKELFCRRICCQTKGGLASWVRRTIRSEKLFNKLIGCPPEVLILRLKQSQGMSAAKQRPPKEFRRAVIELQKLLGRKMALSPSRARK